MSYASCMRLAALLVLATGCLQPSDPSPYPPDPGVPFPPDTSGCHADGDCGAGQVCARDFTCESPADVATIHVNWTLKGDPASAQRCAATPSFDLRFDSSGDYFGFSPVPCDQGRFTIDKLPRWYTQVEISLGEGLRGTAGSIDFVTGIAGVDLPY